MLDKRYVNQMAELSSTEHIQKAKLLAEGYSLTNMIKIDPFIDYAIQLLDSQLDGLGSMKQNLSNPNNGSITLPLTS
jgi:hypothetical protein